MGKYELITKWLKECPLNRVSLSFDELRPPAKPVKPIASGKDTTMEKHIQHDEYIFYETSFTIYQRDIPSPFLQYRGKTMKELLSKKQYYSLKKTVEKRFSIFLNEDIQMFMSHLVRENDNLYKQFLNKNGNNLFCRYGLTDKAILDKRGLYLYVS